MPRTFAYLRVSTIGQTTDNQREEIRAAGFQVEAKRVVTETVSGSVATSQRRGFTRLVDRLEDGDVLVVTKLDRLGRNAMDVGGTVAQLAKIGVRVHCLALGGVDLTSSTGKLTMGVINAVAEFERDLLIERTQAGLARARAEGKAIGRPPSLSEERRRMVEQRLRAGQGASAIARELKRAEPRSDGCRMRYVRLRWHETRAWNGRATCLSCFIQPSPSVIERKHRTSWGRSCPT